MILKSRLDYNSLLEISIRLHGPFEFPPSPLVVEIVLRWDFVVSEHEESDGLIGRKPSGSLSGSNLISGEDRLTQDVSCSSDATVNFICATNERSTRNPSSPVPSLQQYSKPMSMQ